MLVARIVMNVDAENEASFLKIMREDVEKSLAFPGCMRFDLFRSAFTTGEFLLYQEWEKEEHFVAYRDSEHLADIGKKIFALLAGKPDAAYYTAATL